MNTKYYNSDAEHIKEIKRKNNTFTLKRHLTQVTKALVVFGVLVFMVELFKVVS